MTAINTNTASLNAQYFLAKANKEMESSMAKLSSGQKVNSAADDAAGLAIAGRMTSQIKGLNMAIKNANDTVALAQTAEGAMEEVTNMLQRMRELAVQASNGTMNDSDRASLDAEVQALKTEIDRIAGTTQFNNQNLLDGTFSKTFQIGDKTGQTVGLDINSVNTAALGIGSDVSPTSITGTRIASSLSGSIAAGDIAINGQAVGEITDLTDMESVLKAINDNVRNVEATGHNVFVAKQKGTGVTSAGQIEIKVAELGVGSSNETIFQISASGTMKELVSNINAETGGVVAASVNSEGKLVLSNDTGTTIKVRDTTSTTGVFNAGSGIIEQAANHADTVHNGFITLESTDGSDVTVERGNKAATTPGDDADLSDLGFNEVSRQTASDKYSITGKSFNPVTAFAEGDLKINGVDVYDAAFTTTNLGGKIEAINAKSSETGVVASAFYEQTFAAGAATGFTSGDKLIINDVTVVLDGGTTLATIASDINLQTSDHGLTAEASGNNLILKGINVMNVVFDPTDTGASNANLTGVGATLGTALLGGTAGYSRLRLDSVDNTPIRIELGEGTSDTEHGFVETNIGASDFDVNGALFSAGSAGGTSGLSIKTTSDASNALAMLDKAISNVSDIRSDLGALQNRLDHTVNNLSSVSNNTESAKSRIMDTDFATETANLTKQQILSQAATSMLAQANQSKQGILALLQG